MELIDDGIVWIIYGKQNRKNDYLKYCIISDCHWVLDVLKLNTENTGAGAINISNMYRQISHTCYTLVGNKIVDHSNIVGASPASDAQLHLHSRLNTWLQWIG